MQIEPVQRAPAGVDVDFRPAAEERFERLREARQRLVHLVDRIERKRRAPSEMVGDIFRPDARRVSAKVRVRRGIQIAPL